jgi:hypothetical protein
MDTSRPILAEIVSGRPKDRAEIRHDLLEAHGADIYTVLSSIEGGTETVVIPYSESASYDRATFGNLRKLDLSQVPGLERLADEVGEGKAFPSAEFQTLYYLGLPAITSYGRQYIEDRNRIEIYADNFGEQKSGDGKVSSQTFVEKGSGRYSHGIREISVHGKGDFVLLHKRGLIEKYRGYDSSVLNERNGVRLLGASDPFIVVSDLSKFDQEELRWKKNEELIVTALNSLTNSRNEGEIYASMRKFAQSVRHIVRNGNVSVHGFPPQLLPIPAMVEATPVV